MSAMPCNGQACPDWHEHDDAMCLWCLECERFVVKFCSDAFDPKSPNYRRRPPAQPPREIG